MTDDNAKKPETAVKVTYAVLITLGVIAFVIFAVFAAGSVLTNLAWKEFESEAEVVLTEVVDSIKTSNADALETHLDGPLRTKLAPDGTEKLFDTIKDKYGEFVLAKKPQLNRFNTWVGKGSEAVYVVKVQYEKSDLFIVIALVKREDRPIRVTAIMFQEELEGTPKKAVS